MVRDQKEANETNQGQNLLPGGQREVRRKQMRQSSRTYILVDREIRKKQMRQSRTHNLMDEEVRTKQMKQSRGRTHILVGRERSEESK